MKRYLFAALAVALLVSAVDAQQKKFTIGVEDTKYFPHYTTDANGQYGASIAREILDAFAKKRGYEFTYQVLPVTRLFRDFVDQKVDFKYPDNEYWSQDLKAGSKIAYSKPVVDYIDGVFVLPQNAGKGKAVLKTLGTVRGFTAWEYMADLKSGSIRLDENNSFEGLLRQAIAGRIDGAYCSVAVGINQLETVIGKSDALVFDPTLPHTRSAYKFSTIRYPEVIREFDAFLVSDKESIDRLKANYGVNKGL